MSRKVYLTFVFAVAAGVAISAVVVTSAEDAKIRHALDRLTFGPRPGDLEQVRAVGLSSWIDLQLNPKKIPENPVLSEKLQPLDTLTMSTRDMLKVYPTPQMIRRLSEGNGAYPTDPAKRRMMEALVDEHRMESDKNAPKREIAAFLTTEQRATLQSGKKEEKPKESSAPAKPAKKPATKGKK